MRQSAPRLLIMALCLSMALVYVPVSVLGAERRPYFKTYGADVMSGGWFNYKDSPCNTTTNPMTNPDPAPANPVNLEPNFQDGRNNPVDKLTGGIMAYTKSSASGGHFNAAGGSSSQFAAYVLGIIEGNNASNYGFYSNGVSGGAVTGRTFSNNSAIVNATQWGGLFQDDQYDGKRYAYCMPDYYSAKPVDANTTLMLSAPAAGSFTNATTSRIYRANGTASPFVLNTSAVALNTDRNITVYVDGDVYIGGNITFNFGDPAATVSNIPKFAIVARGSIYISKDVTSLYGFYVAQPNHSNISAVTDDDGIVWTCHENNTAPPLYTWIANNCGSKLTITGALAAKQVNFLRINGDVGSANLAEDPISGLGSANIAEVINYHPSMVLNGPFFTLTTAESTRNSIDSLISLPPVF